MSRLVRPNQLAKYMQILKTTDEYVVIKNTETGGLTIKLCTGSDKFKTHNKQIDLGIAIGQHPSDALKDLAYTDDLKTNWSIERTFSFQLGIRFVLKYFGIEDYAQSDLLQELVGYWADRYLALYRIIKKSFRYLKKLIPNCPSTPEALFLQIVEEERSRPFVIRVANPYVEYKPSQLGKYYRELAKPSSPNWDCFKKSVPRFLLTTRSHSLLGKVIEITGSLISTDPKRHSPLKRAVERYDFSTRQMFETAAELVEARTEKGKIIPTVIIKDGEVSYSSYGRELEV